MFKFFMGVCALLTANVVSLSRLLPKPAQPAVSPSLDWLAASHVGVQELGTSHLSQVFPKTGKRRVKQ